MTRVAVVQFYFHPDISAVSQLLGDLLCRLYETGEYDITVYCGTSAYAAVHNAGDERFERLRIVRIRTPNTGRSNLIARALDFLGFYAAVFFRVLLRGDLDAVVSMSSPPLVAYPIALALWLRKVRLVYYVEDLFPEVLFDLGYVNRPWIIRRLQAMNRCVMRRADRVVTLGSFMSLKIALGYPEAAEKLVEIPNWSRATEFAPARQDGGFTLMYSGNMGIAHDFRLLAPLIRALADFDGLQYRFVGGGARFAEVESIFRSTGERRVTLEGYRSREDHESLLALADAFLIAQRTEAVGDLLPSKLYSYLAAGRPLVFLGSRASEIGTLIVDRDLGVVVEHPEDVQTARRYIEFLSKDRERAARMHCRIRRFSDAHYGLERSVSRFQELLTDTREAAV
jgi:colanic acid biosynthesis glycosyl transferase WcaI